MKSRQRDPLFFVFFLSTHRTFGKKRSTFIITSRLWVGLGNPTPILWDNFSFQENEPLSTSNLKPPAKEFSSVFLN
ncbi:hypothetical protein M8J77_001569 [Diaphorina citri]|nr:hypothetical protein M8J77_001569 [Diaphorina citri]